MNTEKLRKLKAAIVAQAELCIEIIDTMLLDEGDVDEDQCPACGTKGKLLDAGTMGEQNRWICAECESSFTRVPQNEVMNG